MSCDADLGTPPTNSSGAFIEGSDIISGVISPGLRKALTAALEAADAGNSPTRDKPRPKAVSLCPKAPAKPAIPTLVQSIGSSPIAS